MVQLHTKNADIPVGDFPLKNFHYEPENKRLLIINGNGEIFIYSLAEAMPVLIKQVETGSDGVLRDICVDPLTNRIYTCTILNYQQVDRCNGWNRFNAGHRKARER